jgi:rhodanese-related sulfurtransferase
MTQQIEAETLRDWLDAQRPVTVLDIRTDEDRARWAIPGSVGGPFGTCSNAHPRGPSVARTRSGHRDAGRAPAACAAARDILVHRSRRRRSRTSGERELNEAGEFPSDDPTELEAGANRCAVR